MKKIDWLWLAVFAFTVVILTQVCFYFFTYNGEWGILNKLMGYLLITVCALLLLLSQPWHNFFG